MKRLESGFRHTIANWYRLLRSATTTINLVSLTQESNDTISSRINAGSEHLDPFLVNPSGCCLTGKQTVCKIVSRELFFSSITIRHSQHLSHLFRLRGCNKSCR